jgi:hydroxymethylpyrimidine/phosphomethylpyrimidine kinase
MPGRIKGFESLQLASSQPPLVLLFGGLDPSGAGLQADIETCFSLGCHALPIATGITVQNTRSLSRVIPTNPIDILDQVKFLIADIGQIAACKIGMLPNFDAARAVAEAIEVLPPHIPVILDPIILTSTGASLMPPHLASQLHTLFSTRVTLIKPNFGEARRLVDALDLNKVGCRLTESGAKCRYALLTGTDEAIGSHARHFLFRDGALFANYRWPVLPGAYHGTGCTLSTAIAAFCARGQTLESAVGAAQCYTGRAVCAAKSIGGAQYIPDRRAAGAGDFRCP